MSLKEFVEKLDQIQASFSTHIPLVIINSSYKIDKSIRIFGRKGWIRIDDPIPIMINYNSLILLDIPKNYMVGVYRNVTQERKIKPFSRSRSQKTLNNASKIKTNDKHENTTKPESNGTSETNTNQNSQQDIQKQ